MTEETRYHRYTEADDPDRTDRFCPLINAKCRKDCVCYNDDYSYLRMAGCVNHMFSGK